MPSSLASDAFHTFPPRNPRRRQRPHSDEHGSLRNQPQRKRSKLNNEIYEPEPSGDTKQDGPQQLNGHANLEHDEREPSAQSLDMPIRSRAQGLSSRRAQKEDGSTVLTQNANYQFRHFLALPSGLREANEDFRASIHPAATFALALTHSQAHVWDYTQPATSPVTRTFSLPNLAQRSDPLPFGSLVPATSASETGLVVVNARDGRIAYWENIENADALSLLKTRKNGVEGSCGALLSGEVVEQLVYADQAGFMLVFSTGRMAQLLLRDAQSQASIHVRFLKAFRSNPQSGFFGSLRNALSLKSWLENISGVKIKPCGSRGLVEAASINEEAIIQIWQLSWSGQTLLKQEIDAGPVLQNSVKSTLDTDFLGEEASVTVADFAILSHSTSANSTRDSESLDEKREVLLLANATSSSFSQWVLVFAELQGTSVHSRRVFVLNSFIAPLTVSGSWKPRLFVKDKTKTAFVVFEKAVTIASLAMVETNPDNQVLQDAGGLPKAYQETIYFKENLDYRTVGAALETALHRSTDPSLILFINNFGVLRITAFEPEDDGQSVSRIRVSAKSKIEEAVFFGTVTSNPLDLAKQSAHEFSSEEVEEAALEISSAILKSESPFIPAIAPSMQSHLDQRAKALENLARHLKFAYPPISRNGKWTLRWHAEKIAAARQIWWLYDSRQNVREEHRLLKQLVIMIHESFKTMPADGHNETDDVRLWFLKDVSRLDQLIAWAYHAVKEMEEHDEVPPHDTAALDLYSDANDIVLGGLETAFKFRVSSAWLYGLEDERMKGTILKSGYAGLPEFWTSTYPLIMKLDELVQNVQKRVESTTAFDPSHPLIEKIVTEIPRLVDMFCKCFVERYRWYSQNSKEDVAASFATKFGEPRTTAIIRLTDIGLGMDGMDLAEKYHDMTALVFLVQDQSDYLSGVCAGADYSLSEKKQAKEGLDDISTRISQYNSRFGTDWSEALYSDCIRKSQPARIFDFSPAYKKEVTQFLRRTRERQKLAWINDIVNERDYRSAGRALLDVAVSQEDKLWNKKVELSLAKLAIAASDETRSKKSKDHESRTQDMLAAAAASHNWNDPDPEILARSISRSTSPNSSLPSSKEALKSAFTVVGVQEKLYGHIEHIVFNALDSDSALGLVVGYYGGRLGAAGRAALEMLFKEGVTLLLAQKALDPETLVDVLTLLDQKPRDNDKDITGSEFLLALQVAQNAGFRDQPERKELLVKMIWRRCFLVDKWQEVNKLEKKRDQAAMESLEKTTLFVTLYEGFMSGLWTGSEPLSMVPPAECIGAGVDPKALSSRFSGSPDICAKLAEDLAAEDKELSSLVDKYRLDHWFSIAKTAAEARFEEDTRAQEEQDQRRQEIKKEIEQEQNGGKSGMFAGRAAGASAMPGEWSDAGEADDEGDGGGVADGTQ